VRKTSRFRALQLPANQQGFMLFNRRLMRSRQGRLKRGGSFLNYRRNDSLIFYVINSTSLVKPAALQQLGTDLSQFNIGIAIIAEMRFSALYTDHLVKIDGYNLFRKDRVGKKGGGVAI
jgi:hypothetical protein